MRRRRAQTQLTSLAAVLSLMAMACLIHGFAPAGSSRHNDNRHLLDQIHFESSSRQFMRFVGSQTRQRRSQTVLAAASAGDAEEHQPQESMTLYDVLGASPSDSYQTLRRKYTTLAREMHPDSNVNATRDAAEFTQLVAAWRVLADPKERLKYDRSLKAKEFTDSMGLFIERSIETAIPFMKKTADTTLSAVETSSKTITNVSQKVGQVSQRMGVAMDILDLERQSVALEQQASKETLQAKRLQDELANIENKKLSKLNDLNIKLSSTEALRILESFDIVNYSRDISRKEIQSLQTTEQQYKEQQRLVTQQARTMKFAQRNVESALQREKLAQERLEAAQRELAAAKVNMEDSLKQQKDATAKEKAAMNELAKSLQSLDKTVENVRVSLKKRQEESLQRISTNLRNESARLEEKAKKLREEAFEIKQKAEKLKQQQERENQKH
jgi:curved DNA-binding protein CbpA